MRFDGVVWGIVLSEHKTLHMLNCFLHRTLATFSEVCLLTKTTKSNVGVENMRFDGIVWEIVLS